MESDRTSKEFSVGGEVDGGIELPTQNSDVSAPEPQSIKRQSKKQALLNELKEVVSIVLYLAGSLCILETYKSLILLQQGVNDFGHNYTVALVEAVALGKIVALAQNLPFLRVIKNRALVWSIIYQSVVMTLIVDLGGRLEDHFFPRSARLLAESGNPIVFAVTHQLVSMLIFIVLFALRGAEKSLGRGTLWKVFFEAPGSANKL